MALSTKRRIFPLSFLSRTFMGRKTLSSQRVSRSLSRIELNSHWIGRGAGGWMCRRSATFCFFCFSFSVFVFSLVSEQLKEKETNIRLRFSHSIGMIISRQFNKDCQSKQANIVLSLSLARSLEFSRRAGRKQELVRTTKPTIDRSSSRHPGSSFCWQPLWRAP